MALTTTEEAQTRALIAQQAAILSLASSEPTIISKLAATKVSLADLTAATSLSGADLFLVRQGTTEKSTALSVLTPDASETVKGIVELATSVETLAGTDNTRAIHPAGLMSGFVKSLAANGYQKLPSGLIIQWGKSNYVGVSGGTINFPISFTTQVYSITCNVSELTGNYAFGQALNPGLSSFLSAISSNTVGAAPIASTITTDFYWIAIGY